MAKDRPSQTHGAASARFWRSVILIAVAHIALIAGLIRWSLAARVSSNPESIVWLGSSQDLAASESESGAPPSPLSEVPTQRPEPKPLKTDEEELPPITRAQSEIELPSPTPKPTPTATATPRPTATPTPKPKTTPKPIPKPVSKKILVAKASPKSSPKTKLSPAKVSEKSAENEKNALAKTGAASQTDSGKTSSAGKLGSVRQGTDSPGRTGGGSSASEFGWYGNMLHDRFYSAWIQPTTNIAAGAKISTLVKVRIEKDGRVSSFEIIKPSENVVVNESVAAIVKQVTQVDPPPTGLINADHYDVKINFELNTEQETAK
jgi:TonB family protein